MLEVLTALIILQEFWLHFNNLMQAQLQVFLLPSPFDLMSFKAFGASPSKVMRFYNSLNGFERATQGN